MLLAAPATPIEAPRRRPALTRALPPAPRARAAAHAPPTVADTKAKFIEGYPRPIPSIYNVVVQELLVQQHFIRHNVAYQYNEVRGQQQRRLRTCAPIAAAPSPRRGASWRTPPLGSRRPRLPRPPPPRAPGVCAGLCECV